MLGFGNIGKFVLVIALTSKLITSSKAFSQFQIVSKAFGFAGQATTIQCMFSNATDYQSSITSPPTRDPSSTYHACTSMAVSSSLSQKTWFVYQGVSTMIGFNCTGLCQKAMTPEICQSVFGTTATCSNCQCCYSNFCNTPIDILTDNTESIKSGNMRSGINAAIFAESSEEAVVDERKDVATESTTAATGTTTSTTSTSGPSGSTIVIEEHGKKTTKASHLHDDTTTISTATTKKSSGAGLGNLNGRYAIELSMLLAVLSVAITVFQ